MFLGELYSEPSNLTERTFMQFIIFGILCISALVSWFTRKGFGLDRYTWKTTDPVVIRQEERFQFWITFFVLTLLLTISYAVVCFR